MAGPEVALVGGYSEATHLSRLRQQRNEAQDRVAELEAVLIDMQNLHDQASKQWAAERRALVETIEGAGLRLPDVPADAPAVPEPVDPAAAPATPPHRPAPNRTQRAQRRR